MKSPLSLTRIIPALLITGSFLFTACKSSPKKPDSEKFFPVLSFIKSQVAMVDSSLYMIMRLTPIDSSRNDTAYIHRDKFRENAVDFLTIPDISDEDFEDRYRETKQFDEGLNLVILTYEPLRPEKELIRSEQVTIQPGIGGDKVKNIIINYVNNTKDSSVEKRMLWNADESFRVSTIKQYPGQPEVSSTYKLTWNERE